MRDIVRSQMEANAQMNAMMHETLNIGGALLVKLFGRRSLEVDRFGERAKQVKKQGVERAYVGSIFMAIIGLLSAVGTALVYGFGGYFVVSGLFTIGTIVAFGSYLGSLYGALFSLANAPMDFATSVVSFERVFEVIDLPLDILEKPDAKVPQEVKGQIDFDDVTFTYQAGDEHLLSDVRPLWQHGISCYIVIRQWGLSQMLMTAITARRVVMLWNMLLSVLNRAAWWHWLDPAARAKPP